MGRRASILSCNTGAGSKIHRAAARIFPEHLSRPVNAKGSLHQRNAKDCVIRFFKENELLHQGPRPMELPSATGSISQRFVQKTPGSDDFLSGGTDGYQTAQSKSREPLLEHRNDRCFAAIFAMMGTPLDCPSSRWWVCTPRPRQRISLVRVDLLNYRGGRRRRVNLSKAKSFARNKPATPKFQLCPP